MARRDPSKPEPTPRAKSGAPGIAGAGTELVQLVVDYAKQETVGALRGMVRWILLGVPGAVLLATGLVAALVGVLRVLQEETGSALTGHWSWAPYAATALVAALLAAGFGARVTKGFASSGQGGRP